MKLKRTVVVLALAVLLASPCAASPLLDTLTGWLDSILQIPRAVVGLSGAAATADDPAQEPQPTVEEPSGQSQEALSPDEPPTDKGGGIDIDG